LSKTEGEDGESTKKVKRSRTPSKLSGREGELPVYENHQGYGKKVYRAKELGKKNDKIARPDEEGVKTEETDH